MKMKMKMQVRWKDT